MRIALASVRRQTLNVLRPLKQHRADDVWFIRGEAAAAAAAAARSAK